MAGLFFSVLVVVVKAPLAQQQPSVCILGCFGCLVDVGVCFLVVQLATSRCVPIWAMLRLSVSLGDYSLLT